MDTSHLTGKANLKIISAAVIGLAALFAVCALFLLRSGKNGVMPGGAAAPSAWPTADTHGGGGATSPGGPAKTPHSAPSAAPTAPPICRNAAKPLEIKDYTGRSQPMHPKVLYFATPWNRYQYWMSYTPYPWGNAKFENPSIAVSNDGLKWETPRGLRNPVIAAPKGANEGAHYSDPQLVLAGDTMQLWFRYNPPSPSHDRKHQTDNDVNVIQYCSSKDGTDWSAPKSVLQDDNDYLSPDILYENGIYKIWYTNYDGKMYYRQSANLASWTLPEQVDILMPGYNIWHQDMIHSALGYETVFCAYARKPGEGMKGMSLYYAHSGDGIHFSAPVLLLSPSQDRRAQDNQMIYRSSIVYVGDARKIFYSAMSSEKQWHIFVTDFALG